MSQWPQYTYLALALVGIGVCLAKHGEPRGPHNFWTDIIGSGIAWWLLYMGGFFKGLLA